MKLGVAQFTPVFKDIDANVRGIEQIIRTTDVDVLVLPELATSGYFFHSADEARGYALHVESEQIQALVNAARETGRVIVCGFAEEATPSIAKPRSSVTPNDGNALYNSALIAGADIATTVYRKTHLFYKENLVFSPGDSGFNVVRLPSFDCTLGTMICYDWRFPEAARTLALKGADLIAAPSNLITHVWRKAMPVRALENKVYLAVANRAGTETNNDESVTFNGDSVIYSYNGEVLAASNPNLELTDKKYASSNQVNDCMLVAEIDPSATRSKTINSFNDILADRRPELYL
ncbi:MAG: nitrilase-related carbon-nitrogen hydrolase [bacterium]|nr:nitrilase-related carbon-nitrogen hydrolase [bacterium]